MTPKKKQRAAVKSPAPPPVVAPVEAEPVEEAPARPMRGMTTEQIRRVGNRIAEHERDLKNNTSRR